MDLMRIIRTCLTLAPLYNHEDPRLRRPSYQFSIVLTLDKLVPNLFWVISRKDYNIIVSREMTPFCARSVPIIV